MTGHIDRWRRGYVTFTLEGAAPEVLLERARDAGIPLWNSRLHRNRLCSHCFAADYRRLRPLLRRSGWRIRLTRKRGLPFLLRGYRRRWGLLTGAVLAAAMLAVLPRYVWIVSVEGAADSAAVTAVMEELGVQPGTAIASLDTARLSLQAMGKLPDAALISLNPEGCILHVDVVPRAPGIPPDTGTAPSDLVAAADGIILEVQALEGFPAVHPGEAVSAGDVLVTGLFDRADFEFFDTVRSRGQVWAQTRHTLTVSVPLKESRLLPTGAVYSRPVWQFLRWEIPLYTAAPLPENCRTDTADCRPVARGMRLPVGLIIRTHTARVPTLITRTKKQAIALLHRRLLKKLAAAHPTATLLQKEEHITVKRGICTLTAVCLCRENIAKEVPLTVSFQKNNEKSTSGT